ncbi:MAG: hypothetical protein R3F11_15670 [Verrucomicrobiales bacterium]
MKIFVSLTAVLFAAEHLAAAPVISEFLADPDPNPHCSTKTARRRTGSRSTTPMPPASI